MLTTNVIDAVTLFTCHVDFRRNILRFLTSFLSYCNLYNNTAYIGAFILRLYMLFVSSWVHERAHQGTRLEASLCEVMSNSLYVVA